ncbi:MAG: double zinc ribbon domain-containing protein [Candidatus Paceibacterota bacterium]
MNKPNKKHSTGVLKKMKDFVLDVLYPKQCVGCGNEGYYICKECEKFTTENNLVCPVSGNSSFIGERYSDL